jgi:peptidyl-prolyl cis-trans isomerase C
MFTRIIILATACAALAAPVHAEEINPVVGKAGDFTLREADLDRLIVNQGEEVQKQFRDNPELKVKLVQELLTKKAVAQRLRKEGYDRKPEVKELLGYFIDDYLFQEYLRKVVVAGVKVPEEALQKLYKEKEKELVLPETIKVRHIFVAAGKEVSAEDRARARAKAAELLQRLKKGEDFARLAQEASDDAESGKTGGELGRIAPGKTSSAEFEKAAFALKVGEVSDVVETEYGFHLVRVDERQEKRTVGFDEARPFMVKELQKEYEQKKAQEFVESVTREAGLTVYADRLGVPREDAGTKVEGGKKEEPVKKEGAK